ncbi:MAG: UDP-N-acetylglucosamine kinase [Enterococcus gilvus]|jgi:UDP-N-acetylglucosamine kinase
MTEALISRLSDQGYNLVIEGTGRTTDVPIQTATMLQSKGYETKMYVTAVPKIESYWNGNSFFDKFYKVKNFFPYAIPIVLDNEPPRM